MKAGHAANLEIPNSRMHGDVTLPRRGNVSKSRCAKDMVERWEWNTKAGMLMALRNVERSKRQNHGKETAVIRSMALSALFVPKHPQSLWMVLPPCCGRDQNHSQSFSVNGNISGNTYGVLKSNALVNHV